MPSMPALSEDFTMAKMLMMSIQACLQGGNQQQAVCGFHNLESICMLLGAQHSLFSWLALDDDTAHHAP